jgi:hypothetical protein
MPRRLAMNIGKKCRTGRVSRGCVFVVVEICAPSYGDCVNFTEFLQNISGQAALKSTLILM